MAERVALALAALVRDFLVPTGEADGLKRHHRDLVGVVDRELYDWTYLLVVDAVDDRHHEHHVDTRGGEGFDRTQLDVEQVADLAVTVGLVRDAVELQVAEAQTRALGGMAKLDVLRELHAVAGALHAEVAHVARVLDRLQEERAERRLAPGKLHAQLAARLDIQAVVQNLRDVDGEHRAAAVLDGRAAVVAQRSLGCLEISTREQALDACHERRIDAHY